MVQSRHAILRMNSTFAAYLLEVQESKYKPRLDWEAGESVLLEDSNTPIVLTQKHADALNQEDLQLYQRNRDRISSESSLLRVGSATLISAQQAPHAYFQDLGEALKTLAKDLGPLFILGDWNTPWLSQKNTYPPVVEAIRFLRAEIDETFNGGFVLEEKEILSFIPHLFWLIRCNASLPDFLMSFRHAKTILQICKYGVLHVEFYSAPERDKLLAFFGERKFKGIENCHDPIAFDDFSGRSIQV